MLTSLSHVCIYAFVLVGANSRQSVYPRHRYSRCAKRQTLDVSLQVLVHRATELRRVGTSVARTRHRNRGEDSRATQQLQGRGRVWNHSGQLRRDLGQRRLGPCLRPTRRPNQSLVPTPETRQGRHPAYSNQ